jgi:hypothetical protein
LGPAEAAKRVADIMKRLVFLAALVSMPAPVLAQSTTSIGASPFAAQRPTTGVFCTQEMTATFCNVVTRPNNSGYGRSGSGSTTAAGAGGAGGGNTSSIPPCPAAPPFNELCD